MKLPIAASRPSKARTVKSRKAKGRLAVQEVAEMLLQAFPSLSSEDVFVKAGSQGGTDVNLSITAMQQFPFGIEVKNQESLNIWAALKQAKENTKLTPVVFFRRSHTPMYVALDAKLFVRLMACIASQNPSPLTLLTALRDFPMTTRAADSTDTPTL